MDKREAGWALIYKEDLVNYRPMGTTFDWGLMMELKRRGAPIVGVFDPVPDFENYTWKMNHEAINSHSWCYKFLWEKRPKIIVKGSDKVGGFRWFGFK